ncbi:hypothetical protein [Sinorhizobium meliloti]|uniref:hypothetical protein n=1 Tax=Rhizobium meliloti TaxID=382 RepID=UPI00338DC0CB
MGNAHFNIVPPQALAASDGHLIIASGNDRQFAAVCRLLGLIGLSSDALLAFLTHLEKECDNSVRSRNARLAAIRTFL